jgi:putative ribosome biogenesis GTPase RsgA
MAVAPHSKYCQICQEKFEDYFVHIQLKTHGIRMSNSDATEKIHQLCSEFQSTQIGDSGKGKSKPIKKEPRRE